MDSASSIAEDSHHLRQRLEQWDDLPENHLTEEQDGNGQGAVQRHFDAIGSAVLVKVSSFFKASRGILAAFLDQPQKERREGPSRAGPLARFALAGFDEGMPT